MPAGSRIRANNAFGLTTDNPLTIGATTINSSQLALLPAVSGNHAVITLDPLRQFGNPEIIIVTAHTGGASSATITRGAYGTAARAHPQGTLWTHAPVTEDDTAIVTSGTRPSDPYEGQLIYETDTDRFVGHDGSNWQTVAQLGTWNTYTPTLTQSNAVTKTVTYARYCQIGKTIIANVSLAVTGSGTASNNVNISLPVTAVSVTNGTIGSGFIGDNSAAINYTGSAYLLSTTTAALVDDGGAGLLGVTGFTAALANNDVVSFHLCYEAV